MDFNKLHIGTVYVTVAFIVSCIPTLYWFSGKLVYASDFEQTKAEINLNIEQKSLNMYKELNSNRIERFTDMIESGKELRPDQEIRFKELQQERHIFMQREVDLEDDRRRLRESN